MQAPLVKRRSLELVDPDLQEQSSEIYKEPCKKVKKCLSIDIPEGFSDDVFTPKISTSRPKSAQFSFSTTESPQTCRSSTSTPPRFAGTCRAGFSFPKYIQEHDFMRIYANSRGSA